MHIKRPYHSLFFLSPKQSLHAFRSQKGKLESNGYRKLFILFFIKCVYVDEETCIFGIYQITIIEIQVFLSESSFPDTHN